VLFFFGRDDSEHVWSDTPNSASVIYSADANALTPNREPPPDIPPVGDDYYKAYAWRNLLLKEEAGPSTHVEWPIQPLLIDTWPDLLFEDAPPESPPTNWLGKIRQMFKAKPKPESWRDQEMRYQAYSDRHRELREDAYIRATGKPIFEWVSLSYNEAAQHIFEHTQSGPDAFPHFWIQVEYAARTFIARFGDSSTDSTFDEKQLPSARDWLRRAQSEISDAHPSAADKATFRAWLMQLHKSEKENPSPTPYAESVFRAAWLNIRSWAGDRELAAKIPMHVYDVMEPYMSGNSHWSLEYSQMLGHAPSAQDPLHPDEQTLCLLNFASDSTLGWMWGDCGNAAFFIMPNELANLDFSQIRAEVVGH
jgi:hypothetical protein